MKVRKIALLLFLFTAMSGATFLLGYLKGYGNCLASYYSSYDVTPPMEISGTH